MLRMVDEPNGSVCRTVLETNHSIFIMARGSRHNHQAWIGGYLDHVTDAMNIGIALYETLNAQRPLAFSVSDVLLAIFLHDIEKPWKYTYGENMWEPRRGLKTKKAQHAFRTKKFSECGLRLSPKVKNALLCIEGTDATYDPNKRVMKPLAALCHMADIWSARGWFNYPARRKDPWTGATRCCPSRVLKHYSKISKNVQ